MLLALRSLLSGSSGAAAPAFQGDAFPNDAFQSINSIAATGASQQSRQTNSGRMLWYSALTKKVVYLGTTIKKLIESNEPFLIPSVEGDGCSQQAEQRSDGTLPGCYAGEAATVQSRQRTVGSGYTAAPITGYGASAQEIGWGMAQAEHIDVELEALAAILAAA